MKSYSNEMATSKGVKDCHECVCGRLPYGVIAWCCAFG